MQIRKLNQKYLTWEKHNIDKKLKANFKNSCLATTISIFNVLFLIGVLIWVGFGINWVWEYTKIREFILAEENKSIGWGVLLSLLIFTVIDALFFFFIYFNIFYNSVFFLSSKATKANLKIISVFTIFCIFLYNVGIVIILTIFGIFIYYSDPSIITLPSIIGGFNWILQPPFFIAAIPFVITIFTFFAFSKNHSNL